MSHMIDTIAYAGETPWHQLGTKVEDCLSPEEMLRAARIDWDVVLSPMYIDVNGSKIDTGEFALIRSDNNRILSTVSKNWKPCQNSEAFKFFNDFVEVGQLKMETAGSLDEGRMVWGLAKTTSEFEVFGGDRIESYILFSNPHKYGSAIFVKSTAIRVVCNNTLTRALSLDSDRMFRQSHARKLNLEDVKFGMNMIDNQMNDYRKKAEFLGNHNISQDMLVEYVSELFPSGGEKDLSKAASKILANYESQPGFEFARGSWWSAFNAVTFYTSHGAARNDNNRVRSLWYGNGSTINNAALNLALSKAA